MKPHHLGQNCTSIIESLDERIFNSENQFSNWIIEGKGNEFPIECSAVIDASGVSGAASKLLDMGTEVEVIAGFQYELNDVPNDGYLDFYLWPKYSPHGYVWMIPKKANEPMLVWLRQTRKEQFDILTRSSKTPILLENLQSILLGERME